MIPRLLAKRRRASSALVITLLCVVLLTIIVIAFMQTMTLALTTAKSYTDIQRTTLAAEAGLDTAIAQIAVATGTNLAFVTGQTNYPAIPGATYPYPLTVIGEGDLTNLAQMMPLVSGPTSYLSNFGTTSFAANSFSNYASGRATGTAAQTVDINTTNNGMPYQFIQTTPDTNMYRASWVVMTNMVGSQPSYTRYAYVVLDDSARINPALMTGTSTATNGYANPTNWYSGPQDINITNIAAQLLAPAQEQQVTAAATSNLFHYSDSTLGETFANRAAYEAVKHLFTSQTNASFDVIPAWLPDGGKPKFNINILSTNPAAPDTAATNIANIISKNLTNFYMRDGALRGTNKTLYVQRVADCIVDYIAPTNSTGGGTFTSLQGFASGQEPAVFITQLAEELWCTGYTNTGGTSSVMLNVRFFLNVWNPYNKPVKISSAHLNVFNRFPIAYGSGPSAYMPQYNEDADPASLVTVNPNQLVVMSFPQQPPITMKSTPASTTGPYQAANLGTGVLDQFQFSVNGQIVCQTPGPFTGGGPPAASPNGGFDDSGGTTDQTNSADITWRMAYNPFEGTEVADPRFTSFYYCEWGETHAPEFYPPSFWKGIPGAMSQTIASGHRQWDPELLWRSRDYEPTRPVTGGQPATINPNAPATVLPTQVSSVYNPASGYTAPEYTRNGPMVSIGELGHVYDPVHAADDQSTNNDWGYDVPPAEGFGLTNAFGTGGARSLRIGRLDEPPSIIPVSPANNWNTNGERAQGLMDLFTVNYTNLPTSGASPTNANYTNLVTGGVLGRINPNTASTNVLAAMLSGIKINSGSANSLPSSSASLANLPNIAAQIVTNRPYSALSDLYKILPMFGATTNYSPAWGQDPYVSSPAVVNRVRQEAFGKLIQHLTVQSRAYRIYVIGQVLDNQQNPRGSVAMEAGVYLKCDLTGTVPRYEPVIQYVRLLK